MTAHADTAPTSAAPAKLHPFERAGLGVAPFRFAGYRYFVGPIVSTDPATGIRTEIGAPGQPMGTCKYCGAGIANVCTIADANGPECVAKLAHDSNVASGILNEVDRAVRLAENDRARERREAKSAAARDTADRLRLAARAVLFANPDALATVANPRGRGTLREWALWCVESGNGGATSWREVARALRAAGYVVEPVTVEERDRLRRVAGEIAEAKLLAEQAAAITRARANRTIFAGIVYTLRDCADAGSFRLNMAAQIEQGGVASLSPRAAAIVREIYAKSYGRTGSRKYEQALVDFDETVATAERVAAGGAL
jgi:hypothetical protein